MRLRNGAWITKGTVSSMGRPLELRFAHRELSMAFRNLLSEDAGAVRTITINRPDKLNALNRETIGELHLAFDQAKQDDSVRVIVLKGAGQKAFVAGVDINELSQQSPVQALVFYRYRQQMMQKVEHLGKPVLCQIGGFALG